MNVFIPSTTALLLLTMVTMSFGQSTRQYLISNEQLIYTDETMDSIENRYGLNGPVFKDWPIDQSIWALKTKGYPLRFFGQWICHQIFFQGSLAKGTPFSGIVPNQPLAPHSFKWCDCDNPGAKPVRNATKGERIKRSPDSSWIFEPLFSGEGIPNVYKIAERELLGLIHKERVYSWRNWTLTDRYYGIGIAYSNDNGFTWEYCGDILLPQYDSLGDFNIKAGNCNSIRDQSCIYPSNIGGVPYLIKNDSIIIYYNETFANTNWAYPSAAAARLSTVIGRAKKLSVSPNDWKKHTGEGVFTENPLTGLGAPLPGIRFYPIPNNGFADMHADATFCRATGRYLMTVNETTFASHIISSIKLYSSADGIHWLFEDYVAGPDSTSQPFYSSFISEYKGATDDDHIVGSQFDILYMKRRGGDDMVTDLYRRHVSVLSEKN